MRTSLTLVTVCHRGRCFATRVPRRAALGPTSSPRRNEPAGWRLLFDGKTFNGWRGLGYDSVPTAHWKIDDGAIEKIASGNVAKMPDGQPANGGDLMTVDTFGDFELALQWKVAPGREQRREVQRLRGVLAQERVEPCGARIRVPGPRRFAERGQQARDASRGRAVRSVRAERQKRLKPVGQWNSSRLVFRGNHGEHWLNGAKVVEFDLGTARMDSALAASKYRSIKGFAERRMGHIILQDHGDETYYRAIKIREVTP